MYAPVSALRSTRFSLMGLGCGPGSGCGCGPCSAPVRATSGLGCGCGPTAGLGQITTVATSLAAGFSIAAAGGVGFMLGYFLGKHAQRAGLAPNSRRRRLRRAR